LLFFRNPFSLFDLQLHAQILIYLQIIHALKSSTFFEHYPAHLQEVYVVTVYMQPLVSSLPAGDCLVRRLRKNQYSFSLFTDILIERFRVRMGLKLGMVNLVVTYGPWRVTRSDIGLDDLKHLRKGTFERMMRVLGRPGLRVVSLSPCFRGGVWGVKYCWNWCSSILAFETSSQFFFRVAV
jgi:hypothetical protein